MSAIFLKILNMSITASWLILTAIVIRLLLRKAPKWISCILWVIVALRLLIPFSFKSALSLIPNGEPIPSDFVQTATPTVNTGISVIDHPVNAVILDSFTPNVGDSVNPLQILVPVLSIIWITGVVLMLMYALVSFLKLLKTVSASVDLQKGVKVCDEIVSPFILGVIKPVIYVPSSLIGKALENVLAHENAHLSRKDHWWKPLGFFLLAIYWFNPLCWVAYVLLCRDIEAACDERVIRDMDKEDRAEYSQSLLDLSFSRRSIVACPLAFGEVGVKERVKGVLNYRKPTFWIIVIAIVACIVVAVCFLTNPKDKQISKSFIASITSIKEPAIYVRPADGSDELKSSNSFAIPINKLEDGYVPQVGDELEIFYDGYIYETYPASLGTIEKIVYLSRSSEAPSATSQEEVQEISQPSSGEKEDSIPIDDKASVPRKTYVWEKEGFGGAFTITLYDDGTFEYYVGYLSSHIGLGNWEIDKKDSLLRLSEETDKDDPNLFTFEVQAGKITYIANESSDFMYVTVEDGDSFVLAGIPNTTGYELAPFEREIEINTCHYDITHDGSPDTIQVTYIVTDDFDGVVSEAMFHNGALGFVKLFEGEKSLLQRSELLWYRDYGTAHAGNVQIFVTTVDGNDYLVETSLYSGQGTAYYYYSVFFFENGEQQVVDSGELTFDTNSKTDTTALFDGIYSWINPSSVLLMATDIELDPDIYYSHGEDIVRPETYYSQRMGYNYMEDNER